MPLPLGQLMANTESQYDLPPGLLAGVMSNESTSPDYPQGGNPNAVSPAGAVGPFQLMPSMIKELAIKDPTDINEITPKVAQWWSDRLDKNNQDVAKTAAEWNWGPGNVAKHGMDAMPDETRNFIKKLGDKTGIITASPMQDNEIDQILNPQALKITIPGGVISRHQQGSGELSDDEINGILSTKTLTLNNKLSDDEIIKAFGYDPDTVKSSDMYRQGMFVHQITDPNSFVGKLGHTGVGSMLMGVADVGQAVEQLKAHIGQKIGVGFKPEDTALVDLNAKLAEADYNQNWKGRQPGQAGSTGENLTRGLGSMLIPLPGMGVAGKAAGAAAKLVTGASEGIVARGVVGGAKAAATGAAGAPAAAPVTDNSTNPTDNSFGNAKMDQAKMGAMFAPLVALGSHNIEKATGKIINTYKGNSPPGAQDLIDTANRWGIRTGAGDVAKNPVWHTLTQAMRNVPILGTNKFLEGKEADIEKAAPKFSAQMHDEMINTKFENMNEIEKAAKNVGNPRRQKAAAKILENLKAEGSDDWTRIMQNSANAKLLRNKLISDKLYDKVGELAGEHPVWTTNTQGAIDAEIKTLRKVDTPDGDKVIQQLEDMKARLGKGNNYDSLRAKRTYIAGEINRLIKLGDTNQAGILQSVKDGITADLDKYGSSAKRPDLKAAAAKADRFYKENVVPFQDKAMVKALDTSRPDEIYGQFIKRGKGDLAKQFYSALDDKGKAAVRYGMVEEAMSKAFSEKEEFNPQTFAKYLKSIQEAKDVFFRGEDKWELDGFTNLMAHIGKTSGGHWGHAMLAAVMGEGMLSHAFEGSGEKVVKAVSSVLFAKAMLTTPGGRRLLLASSDLKEGSPAMGKLWDKIQLQLPNLVGNMAGNKEQKR